MLQWVRELPELVLYSCFGGEEPQISLGFHKGPSFKKANNHGSGATKLTTIAIKKITSILYVTLGAGDIEALKSTYLLSLIPRLNDLFL